MTSKTSNWASYYVFRFFVQANSALCGTENPPFSKVGTGRRNTQDQASNAVNIDSQAQFCNYYDNCRIIGNIHLPVAINSLTTRKHRKKQRLTRFHVL